MVSETKGFDMDDKVDSRRSSVDSSITDVPVTTPSARPAVARATTSQTASTSTSSISKTNKSTTSSTKSKRFKVKSWLKRVGSGMLASMAYHNAVEYSPAAVQYWETKKGERTLDEVLSDIYGVPLFY
ncbi:hypothetical protein, variant [Verruconis gallopava]|uniref:Uncharacterized protein n=1 Tax=Verruconis gallopava TaxID=253628 RepID=A0A0D2ABX9_9PEZI|nr:hypothetical protein, variant [Verruconis gallopava]KIW04358.1 hypothetical protein, variant [Verruconis gallopava]